MGHIANINLSDFIEKYKINIFVESGTADGAGLRYVYTNSKFKNYYSSEINEKVYNNVKQYFPEENVHLFFGDTITELPKMLDLVPQEDVILFWLDAHLPEFSDPTFKASSTQARIPLKKELEVIKSKRKKNHDVIICDDLRIYEDGPFPHGNWKDRFQFGDLGTTFIFDIMGGVYRIEKIYQHEGYIYILPLEEK